MNKLLEAVQPALITLALAVLSGCAIVATAFFQRLASKLRESKDREALHMAMTTGASLGMNKYGRTSDSAVAYAVDYASKSVPDAIANLTPREETPRLEVLGKLAKSKIEQASLAATIAG